MKYGNDNSQKVNLILNLLIGLLLFLSASNTYTQLGLGLTPVTLVTFISLPFIFLNFYINKFNLKISFFDLNVALILILAFFSQLWTFEYGVWSNNFFWYCICIISYFVTRFSIKDIKSLKLISFFIIISIFYNYMLIDVSYDNYGNKLERYSIEGVNINYTAYSIVCLLYIYILLYKINILNNKFSLVFVNIFSFYMVYILQTRGALLSIILMWLWVFIYKINNKSLRFIYLTILLLLIFFISFGFLNQLLFIIDSIFFENRSTGDLSGRGAQWNLAYTYIIDNPILGMGIGSFESINPNKIAVHNFYLNTLLELGIVGFLLYGILFLSPIFRNRKLLLNEKSILIFGLYLSFIFPISLSGNWQLAPILWVAIAITFNTSRSV